MKIKPPAAMVVEQQYNTLGFGAISVDPVEVFTP